MLDDSKSNIHTNRENEHAQINIWYWQIRINTIIWISAITWYGTYIMHLSSILFVAFRIVPSLMSCCKSIDLQCIFRSWPTICDTLPQIRFEISKRTIQLFHCGKQANSFWGRDSKVKSLLTNLVIKSKSCWTVLSTDSWVSYSGIKIHFYPPA